MTNPLPTMLGSSPIVTPTTCPNAMDQIESLFYHLPNDDRKDVVNKLLSTFVNGASGSDLKELATDISNDHRTLVSDKFRFMLYFCEILANHYKQGRFDARNEYACQTSAKIMDLINGIVAVPRI